MNFHNNKCDCDNDKSIIEQPVQQDEMIEDFLIRTRRICLVGDIDELSSTYICNQLQFLSITNKPIYMYINSPGGSLGDGYCIIDQMMMCKCPVYTIIRGNAYSMGAIIAAFGEKGHRYSTPNSSIMLHSIILQSKSESIEKHLRMTQYVTDDYTNKISDLAKRLKLNIKQLTKLMSETQWMSANKAIKIGLIDKIWTPKLEQSIN